MKKYFFLLFLISYNFCFTSAQEELTREQLLDKKIQSQVDSGLWTIKVFLSEYGKCEDILTNKVISTWYKAFIEEVSTPMELRTKIFQDQTFPLEVSINELKKLIEVKTLELKEKKQAFVDDYIIWTDNENKLQEIETVKNEILKATSNMNTKNLELESIRLEYTKHLSFTREEITEMYESKILSHCNDWFGKVELTDKRTLEQFQSDLASSLLKPSSKYKKTFDKLSIIYIKNPKSIEKLYTRVDKAVRKMSKTHKSYEFISELRKHLKSLLGK